MTRVSFVAGLDDLIDDLARPELERQAEIAARAVKSATPKRSGTARAKVDVVDVDGRPAVSTTDPAGHIIEYGSINNPPYAPFRRGADQVGRFKE